MSYLSPPVSITGLLITLANPGAIQNTAPPVNVQVRNASSYVITVQGQNGTNMIDPFTATTIAIATGQPVLIDPIFDAFVTIAGGYIALEWLLAGESPSEPDGPLTGPATIAGIISTVNASTLLLNEHAYSNGTMVIVTPAPGEPYLEIVCPITAGNPGDTAIVSVEVIGGTTGAVYLFDQLGPIDTSYSIGSLIFVTNVKVEPLVDSTYEIVMTVTTPNTATGTLSVTSSSSGTRVTVGSDLLNTNITNSLLPVYINAANVDIPSGGITFASATTHPIIPNPAVGNFRVHNLTMLPGGTVDMQFTLKGTVSGDEYYSAYLSPFISPSAVSTPNAYPPLDLVTEEGLTGLLAAIPSGTPQLVVSCTYQQLV